MGLLCVISGGYIISTFCKKRWLEAVPLSAFLIMIATYFMGIFDLLSKIWLLKWGIVLSGVIMSCHFFRVNGLREWKKRNGLSSGTIFFIMVSIIMTLLLSSHLVIDWDDLNHWGTMVKQMFYINKIPKGTEAISGYSDYPPIGSLFIYWFLSDFKEFHECLLFPIYYFSVLICLIPFYEKIPDGRDKIPEKIGMMFICLLLPGAFASTAMFNLKIDSFVTVLFLFIIISFLKVIFFVKELYLIDLIEIFSALCVLILTKSVGIYLAVFATIALMILVFGLKKKRMVISSMIGAGIEGIVYFSWKIICQKYGNSSHTSNDFKRIQVLDYLRTLKAFFTQMPLFLYPILFYIAATFLLVIFIDKDKVSDRSKNVLIILIMGIDVLISLFCRYGYLSTWFEKLVDDGGREYVTKHYIYYFCRQSITFQREVNATYGMSALECIMLVIIIMLLVKFSVDKEKFRKFLTIQNVLLMGFVVYVIGQLAMYRYMFIESGASILTAYSRYLMMYLGGVVGGVYYLVYCGVTDYRGNGFEKRLTIKNLLLFSMIFLSNIPYTFMCIFGYHEGYFAELWERREEAVAIADKVKEGSMEPAKGILIKDKGDWIENVIRYQFIPERGFKYVIVLEEMDESELPDVLEGMTENIEYLIVDRKESNSEEDARKRRRILEYYEVMESNVSERNIYMLED